MEYESDELKKRIPFKLCFLDRRIDGKSNIRIGKPLKLAPILQGKFYSKYEHTDKKNDANIHKYEKYLDVKGPREKYKRPLTENQRYGWYQEVLSTIDRSDRRLHFAKHTNILVKEHLMNYCKIRE